MRLVLCLLQALAAAPAWAGWVKVSDATDGTFRTYIDPATLRVSGDLRRIWILNNEKVPKQNGEFSSRNLQEYDCKGDRMRILALSVDADRKLTSLEG